ncbi:tyrosine-type recombinase/integrase [Candidatus Enterococcus ferrettii]|uniref:Site-specific integrase n=1 Tax=Candidatus Enterococcus ferrettii TaxID=2815324 RepID=A0ABV0EMZ1_9ENTE|nr:site-specific integrase [Enterococcus sp. 665A]MBO1339790.1 tyrosine-type recombinase/integrase [Enterococcus sp. 665A]
MRRGENIYRRKDKRWEGRYRKGTKSNGKSKYGSVYGKTLQEVRAKLYPLKMKYQLVQTVQGEAAIPLNEWGYRWLQEVKPGVKPSTYANYEHKLVHYVLSVIGHYDLNELDEAVAEELLESLMEQSLKPSTIHVIFRITKQCMNQAIRKKLIKENPFGLIPLPKVVKNRNQALTRQEQKQLETVALKEEKGQGLPTVLALHTGLRIGEISALTWQDIDFENNLIHVRSTFQRIFGVYNGRKTELLYSSSKTATSTRSIPMSQAVKQLLLQHKEQAEGPAVFCRNHRPWEPRLLTYHFHRIREKAGLSHVHFHQLRHTFATRCLESQGDIMSVSALLGHSSTQMTLDTYAGTLVEQRIQVVAQMEEAIL